MTPNLDELERVAKCLGGKEWKAYAYPDGCESEACVCEAGSVGGDVELIAKCQFLSVAAFIAAANPATVLALIQRCRRAEELLGQLEMSEDMVSFYVGGRAEAYDFYKALREFLKETNA